ncbi:MAG: histone-lysine N-methyltransferase [Desulfohalobiaceae bacterium]|nr:histone-lysine N-methyltransferase [Desulfohalobiaceae bacterium]
MTKSLLHLTRSDREQVLKNPETPDLHRTIYPYKKISRVNFDDTFIMGRPADPVIITDTTFRDGQQARPPYSIKQMSTIFDLLHKLGGQSGLIRQSEFFLYSDKDRRAVETCLAKGYTYPEITGWIRCNLDDLRFVKNMGLKETGMLTSVSDYHIYLKLNLDRRQAMENYLRVVEKALEMGISPRCHFEDITRADIYGFCIPFARKLMSLSRESGLPVKIRLCDTLGYGVPYPGASLPRNVAKIIRAFTDDGGVPGRWLEWHGHNDFHKALINASTAWLYGCSAANGTLLGFGERTGNAPLEALVIEYISLTGDDDSAYTRVIAEIAEYFEKELNYRIPPNYPFVGRDFNATSAGIHADGLSKNEEIYNIFDTNHILGRSTPVIINDKSGKAGIAYWINQTLEIPEKERIPKSHPAVGRIHKKVLEQYNHGRNTSFSHEEIMSLVRRYLPEYFISEYDHLKQTAQNLAAKLIEDLTRSLQGAELTSIQEKAAAFLEEYPFIQYLYVTDKNGWLRFWDISHPEDKANYENVEKNKDLADREWYRVPISTGKLHTTDFYRSSFTGKLCITISCPILDSEDEIQGILGADLRFEELMKIYEEFQFQEQEEEQKQ